MYGKINKRRFGPQKVLLMVLMVFAFVALCGGLIMLLWNAILPNLLKIRPISFGEAVGLFVLSRLLFGGLRWRFWKGGNRKGYWAKKKEWREKWMNMSEEERAEFKARWRERCKKRDQ